MQFVQFVVLTERSALWARPRDGASSVVGLDMSHAFCIDFFTPVHSLTRHSFLIFVVFHHPLQQLVCLVFLLAVRSAHLFSCLVEARRAASVVLTVA